MVKRFREMNTRPRFLPTPASLSPSGFETTVHRLPRSLKTENQLDAYESSPPAAEGCRYKRKCFASLVVLIKSAPINYPLKGALAVPRGGGDCCPIPEGTPGGFYRPALARLLSGLCLPFREQNWKALDADRIRDKEGNTGRLGGATKTVTSTCLRFLFRMMVDTRSMPKEINFDGPTDEAVLAVIVAGRKMCGKPASSTYRVQRSNGGRFGRNCESVKI